MLGIALGASALALLLGVLAISLGWRAAARAWAASVAWRPLHMPPWIAWPMRCMQLPGRRVDRRLPAAIRVLLQRRLVAAELGDELSAGEWLAGALLLLAVAVVAASLLMQLSAVLGSIALLAALPWTWLRDRSRRRELEILRQLPFLLDALALALESGSTLSGALHSAGAIMPDGALRRALRRLQSDLRAGRQRGDAMRAFADYVAMPAGRVLAAAVIQADASGGSLAQVLRAQAEARSHERFIRAERLAMQAPVKMLAPLVLCIFPCTFMVLAFTIAVRLRPELGGVP
jgi:tight adherence protein C